MICFAQGAEKVCIAIVEEGKMPTDLAVLIGPDQPWTTIEQFFEAVRVSMEAKMANWA